MKKKDKTQKKGKKQVSGGEQKGENGPQTAVQQQKGEKSPKGQQLKKKHKMQKEGTEKHKKTSQKNGSNSSGTKLKK